MFELQPAGYPGEPLSVKWQGEMVAASRFGDSQFMAACEAYARFSRPSLAKIWTAYVDNKIFLTGNRRSGEPSYHHPVGVALIGILEFGVNNVDSVVADLAHDIQEDSPFFQGHTSLVGQFESFRPIDMLTGRYGEKAAKIVMCVSKPDRPTPKTEMSPDMNEAYLHWVYNRVINLYPDVRVESAQTKVRDRIFNTRTEADPQRLAGNLLETMRYIVPIAEIAGELYATRLREEIRERESVLTAEQRILAVPQVFNLE